MLPSTPGCVEETAHGYLHGMVCRPLRLARPEPDEPPANSLDLGSKVITFSVAISGFISESAVEQELRSDSELDPAQNRPARSDDAPAA